MPTHENKIEDFGAKFWGARKDMWAARGLLFSDLNGASLPEKQKYVNKSNVLPKINYQELYNGGLSRNVVYFYKSIIDSLPTKPQYKDKEDPDETITNYINYLSLIKNDLFENVKNDSDIDSYWNHVKTLGIFKVENRRIYPLDKYHDLLTDKYCSVSQKGLFAISKEVNNKNYLLSEKEIEEKNYKIFYFDANNVQFQRSWNNNEDVLKVSTTTGGAYYFYNFPQPKDQWKENTYFLIRNNMILDINFSSKEEALNKMNQYVNEHLSKAADNKEQGKTRKKAFVPPKLENVRRISPFDWLSRDANSNDFLDELKFRGGEFGNWENQEERQLNLNHAYNAFKDISYILNLSDESVSGNGKLGIAFGSRGVSKAAAHYEPLSTIINLTRMNGAGTLGHEWGHFFDYQLSDDPKTPASEDYSSMEEMKDLIQTMKYSKRPYTEEEFSQMKEKNLLRYSSNLKRQIDYSFSPTRLTVEQQQERERLIQLLFNDLKENPAIYSQFFFSKGEEPKALENLSIFRKNTLGHIISKEDRRSIAGYGDSYGREINRNYDPNYTIRIDTNFFKGSKYFDNHYSSGKAYWQSNTEMFARAFHCYLKDKLAAQNMRNDYLCGLAEAFATIDKDGNVIKAFPEGEERIKINMAFDKLIEKVKEQSAIFEPRKDSLEKIIKEEQQNMENIQNTEELSLFDISLEDEQLNSTDSKLDDQSKLLRLTNNLGFKIDSYLEDLYDESGINKYFTPYELLRNTIEYHYDVETNSIVLSTWLGNIACESNPKNDSIVGETLVEKLKREAAGEKTSDLDKDIQLNNKFYELDFDNVPEEKMEEYLNRLLKDFSAEIEIMDTNLKGSSQYFKFDDLINKYAILDIQEDKKTNTITALKECKNEALKYLDLSKCTPEEIKTINISNISKIVSSELSNFNIKTQDGLTNLYRYMSASQGSYQNHLLLHNQCRIKGHDSIAFGTFNEWKERHTSIKAGEKAMFVLTPVNKRIFYEIDYDSDAAPMQFISELSPVLSAAESSAIVTVCVPSL